MRPPEDEEEEEEEEILGSDDDEQEDPKDYVKGNPSRKSLVRRDLELVFLSAQVVITRSKSGTSFTIAITSCGNLAGDIFRRFGCVGT